MTQEEKQLLLKDLCGRLPYEVHGEYSWKCGKPYERELTGNLMAELILSFNSSEDSEFKPYLRPMASMTEEEIEEYRNLSDEVVGSYGPYHREFIVHCVRLGIKPGNPHECVDDFLNMEAIDWLNEHHFDYRGLIEKGLALEAPEDMYK